MLDLENPSAKVILQPDSGADYIAISPDGRWAATGSWQSSQVKVWDGKSGELVRTLPMPGRATVSFSPDGRWLATASTHYQLWSVGSWEPRNPPIPGHPIPHFNHTTFSPDSRLMAIVKDAVHIQ